ncbi:unnamed protein product [Lactuca saligna]|uniref:Uncharacterized protein n=1 Tax=Lactuca saligna TaxID=75948 RepID=A0AA35ZBY7_LACSI|nr:unnamed protein product [Lactuca saligna]
MGYLLPVSLGLLYLASIGYLALAAIGTRCNLAIGSVALPAVGIRSLMPIGYLAPAAIDVRSVVFIGCLDVATIDVRSVVSIGCLAAAAIVVRYVVSIGSLAHAAIGFWSLASVPLLSLLSHSLKPQYIFFSFTLVLWNDFLTRPCIMSCAMASCTPSYFWFLTLRWNTIGVFWSTSLTYFHHRRVNNHKVIRNLPITKF